MGHPVEIFTSPPSQSCICAVCLDILKDAVGINCGHSFCEECAKDCLSSKSCPKCRADFTSYVPNYTLREFIGSVAVKCPHGENDDYNKRAKSNNGEAMTSPNERCNWTGNCQDLQTHENVCQFKIISCSIDGCNHPCLKKYMANHMSGDGFVHHMNLMKQSITESYENKMEDMKKSFERKMEVMKQTLESEHRQCIARQNSQIHDMKRRIAVLESKKEVCTQIARNNKTSSAITPAKKSSVAKSTISPEQAIESALKRHQDSVFKLLAAAAARGEKVVPHDLMFSARRATTVQLNLLSSSMKRFNDKGISELELSIKIKNAESAAVKQYSEHLRRIMHNK